MLGLQDRMFRWAPICSQTRIVAVRIYVASKIVANRELSIAAGSKIKRIDLAELEKNKPPERSSASSDCRQRRTSQPRKRATCSWQTLGTACSGDSTSLDAVCPVHLHHCRIWQRPDDLGNESWHAGEVL